MNKEYFRRTELLLGGEAVERLWNARVKVAEFWDVQGDPLARSLRKRFHKEGRCPSRPFQCVYSEEILPMRGIPGEDEARVNGTMVHVTAIFGHTLAGLALKELSGLETP
ncbi:MAG: hypothetical protein IJM35_09270 [Bacteroidales bacterium]|nr:hypothetical protein [Bacteroidales bacterium]